jgi:S-adenosylmethionine decarboxylase
MMFDVDQSVAALFYHDGDGPGDEITVSPSLECDKVTAASGIHGIFPGAFVHGWVFAPCGYSCNGVVGSSYFTIHVTPQEKSSYVSFGTNVKLADYSDIVQKVLAIFKPQVLPVLPFPQHGVVRLTSVVHCVGAVLCCHVVHHSGSR